MLPYKFFIWAGPIAHFGRPLFRSWLKAWSLATRDVFTYQQIPWIVTSEIQYTCNHNDNLKLLHTSQFFVVELQIFCWGQIRPVKFVGILACLAQADFLSTLTAFKLGTELISAILEKTLGHRTLMAISHWLMYAWAPTNCLGSPHTSWQGPTRCFEI